MMNEEKRVTPSKNKAVRTVKQVALRERDFVICICVFIPIKNYSKLVLEQTMFVVFVRLNQKLYTIYFTNALTQAILNFIGAFCSQTK